MVLIFLKNLQNQRNQLKKKKALTLKTANERQKLLNASESGIFSKEKQVKGLTSI